jgi:hypothetical protein
MNHRKRVIVAAAAATLSIGALAACEPPGGPLPPPGGSNHPEPCPRKECHDGPIDTSPPPTIGDVGP